MQWRGRIGAGSIALATVVLLSTTGTAHAAGNSSEDRPAPLLTHHAAIAGSYIVALHPETNRLAADSVVGLAGDLGGTVTYRYSTVLNGFAATLSDQAVDQLRRDPRVAYIEQQTMNYPDTVPLPSGNGQQAAGRQVAGQDPQAVLQTNQTPPADAWGLDRIDQRALPLNNTYSYTTTGDGVTVYVIDTGIRHTHTDFGGRAAGAADFVEDGMGTSDCWTGGHGTPVAGMIGGTSYGVAKEVQLRAVRIFGCNTGSPDDRLIAALEWVAENAVTPAVVNMSFNGFASTAKDQAVAGMVAAGLVLVASSGNDSQDTCQFSPRHADMLKVGSVELVNGEQRRFNSNHGPCTDVHAPGASLRGPSPVSDTAVTDLRNGTSFASPHVAGIAARLLETNPNLTSAQVQTMVINSATVGALNPASLPAGTPNRIAFIAPGS